MTASRSILIELRRNVWRARKMIHLMSGHSYHNAEQGIGKAFVPERLEGYFNDLTGKTLWAGATDPQGFPLMLSDSGKIFLLPIVLFQFALGHWDRWLLSGKKEELHKLAFFAAADWAVENVDSLGGWSCWHVLKRGDSDSPYSSMAQGEGLSVLARAYAETGNVRYAEVAAEVSKSLTSEPSLLSVNRRYEGSLVLEEYPGTTFPSVLNGWVFSLFGLYDHALAVNDVTSRRALAETLDGLIALLHRYDSGYWSYYDLAGNLAGPFYHKLHIAQLQALALAFPTHRAAFELAKGKFERYERSFLCRTRAISKKIVQKLSMRGVEEIIPAVSSREP